MVERSAGRNSFLRVDPDHAIDQINRHYVTLLENLFVQLFFVGFPLRLLVTELFALVQLVLVILRRPNPLEYFKYLVYL